MNMMVHTSNPQVQEIKSARDTLIGYQSLLVVIVGGDPAHPRLVMIS